MSGRRSSVGKASAIAAPRPGRPSTAGVLDAVMSCSGRALGSLLLVALLGCAAGDDGKSLDDAATDREIDGGAIAALDASSAASGGEAGGPFDRLDGGDHPEPGRLAGMTVLHNAVRAKAGANPALPPLTWSPAIAEVARAYAQSLAARCAPMLEHSSSEQRMGYGENLASFSDSSRSATRAPGTAAETVAVWESERACYHYGPFQSGVNASCSAECAAYGGCGHYTQIVWRGTRSFGCGIAECKDGQTFRSYWVCHYDPPGNVRDALPY